ncbi:DUF4160 domain-containing protein [endosymbiont GvMRE of Glomus versiforme]|uniref:DUF4160 domain-containing protein n=1 Tax=endosymbiont GvMRE of Glomus versiforme TaxID=2039283 RepID=UPI000EC2471B|nr:DUF4160 domain-containing protein [endosymbiont GvMRE of Glomus versiforme]RHZ36209.1 hypothetical protein GvMRE_Ic2g85 [endosymbiont GvMRE of Glomus versiforme]
MPTWKIKSYWFYFKIGEVLEEHKGIHIHAETSRGGVGFWIEKGAEKSKYTVKIKQIEGYVSLKEKNETKRIVQEQADFFFQAWIKA